MDYDVLILGGGIIGCAIAYELSKYNLNIALIEKDYDIADDIASINTAIVHDGIEGKNDIMSKLQIMGNKMFDDITKKFNVPFSRTGSLMIAQTDEQAKKLKEIYSRAIKRGVTDIELIDENRVYEMEPNLKSKVKMAIHSKNTGVICPYDLALAYAEIAFDNGANFRLEEEVLDIQNISKGLRVTTNKNKFTCKVVVNTTPHESYEDYSENKQIINSREYTTYGVVDKEFEGYFNHVIYSINSNNKKLYSLPSLNGTTIAGVGSDNYLNFSETLDNVNGLIKGVNSEDIISIHNGYIYKDNIMIDDSTMNKKGYIKITGNSFCDVTITPAISNMVCESIISNLNCKHKKNFIDKRREFYRFKDMNNEERNQLIKIDKRYANIICLCNEITEAEIIDSIRRPLGARTVEGVKRRTGVTFGSCQGAYCLSRIMKILARETNKKFNEIVNDSKQSKMIKSRIKEFDEM